MAVVGDRVKDWGTVGKGESPKDRIHEYALTSFDI